jgi:hypothetical protein
LIGRAKAGLLVDPTQPEAAALSILSYDRLMNETLRVEQHHIMTFANERDWTHVADTYVGEYERVLARAGT